MSNSVIRSIKILKLLSKKQRLSLSEISDILNIPKSACYYILKSLEKENFIVFRKDLSKNYELGLSVYEVGVSYLESISNYSIIHTSLEGLSNEYNTTAFLAVEDQGEIVYIDKVEQMDTIQMTTKLGRRRNMHHTALGKSILSTHSEEEVRQILKNNIKPITQKTVTDFNELMEDLKYIKERGYAIDDRETNINILCVGAAILNKQFKPFGAISLSFLYDEAKTKDLDEIGKRVKSVADQISEKLHLYQKKYI